MRYHVTHTRMARIKKSKKQKRKTASIGTWRHLNTRATVENSLMLFDTELPCDPAMPRLRYTLKRTEKKKKNPHSSTNHNSQELETTQMSIDCKGINTLRYIRTPEYYSAMKRHEVLTHATTWANPGDVMLSEGIQVRKATRRMNPFAWNIKRR